MAHNCSVCLHPLGFAFLFTSLRSAYSMDCSFPSPPSHPLPAQLKLVLFEITSLGHFAVDFEFVSAYRWIYLLHQLTITMTLVSRKG